jgi:hypothetical protein
MGTRKAVCAQSLTHHLRPLPPSFPTHAHAYTHAHTYTHTHTHTHMHASTQAHTRALAHMDTHQVDLENSVRTLLLLSPLGW